MSFVKATPYILLAWGIFAFMNAPSAGTISYTDGKTEWTSTGCVQPTAPQFAQGDTAAMNRNTEAYNAYTKAVETYLQCLAREANADMTAVNQGVTAKLNEVNAAWSQDLGIKRGTLGEKRGY